LRWIHTEDPPVGRNEQLVIVHGMNGMDHSVNLFEDEKNDQVAVPTVQSDQQPRLFLFRPAGQKHYAGDDREVDHGESKPFFHARVKDQVQSGEKEQESDGDKIRR
jgi:hypothetical protein